MKQKESHRYALKCFVLVFSARYFWWSQTNYLQPSKYFALQKMSSNKRGRSSALFMRPTIRENTKRNTSENHFAFRLEYKKTELCFKYNGQLPCH
jgi:hypothetical protein